MAVISIEIFSDIICPWCYIGYRTLQRAIALYKKTYPGRSQDEFQISWKPYFIDQEPPSESILIRDRMLRKMDPKQVEATQARLKRVGAGVGLDLKFGGYIGSSRLAHRLLFMAKRQSGSELQCKVAELPFRYQFEEETDISQVGVVVAAGVQAGLDEGEVRGWLERSDAGVVKTMQEAKETREAGVRGVPYFLIGEGHHLDGAVDFSEFFEAFVAVRQGSSEAD